MEEKLDALLLLIQNKFSKGFYLKDITRKDFNFLAELNLTESELVDMLTQFVAEDILSDSPIGVYRLLPKGKVKAANIKNNGFVAEKTTSDRIQSVSRSDFWWLLSVSIVGVVITALSFLYAICNPPQQIILEKPKFEPSRHDTVIVIREVQTTPKK